MRVPPGGGVSGSGKIKKGTEEKARLVIESLTEIDGGRYKCRTDFKKSPTKNYRMELTVLGKLKLTKYLGTSARL
jgi:hypothetical protein